MPTSAPYTAPALTGNGVYVSSASTGSVKGASPSTISGLVKVSTSAAGAATAKGAATAAAATGAAGASSAATASASGTALHANAGTKQTAFGFGAVGGVAAVVLSLLL